DHTRGRLALHAVHDRAADAGDAEEVLLRLLHTLGDRRGHLLGLAVADADEPVAVAHDHQGGEAEAPSALHDLGHAVDRDQALDVRGLVLGRPATASVPAVAAMASALANAPGVRAPAVTPCASRHQTFPSVFMSII